MKKMTTKKKWTIALSLVLVAALAIGSTLAYLSMQSNDKENAFSFITSDDGADNDLKIILIEPDWDGDTTADGNNDLGTPDEELGEEMAKEVQPGDFIPKDPQIKNTSKSTVVDDELWVAMKMTFYKTNGGTLEELSDPELAYLLGFMDFYYVRDLLTEDYDIDLNVTAANPGSQTATWTRLDNGTSLQNSYFYYNSLVGRNASTKPLFTNVYFSLEDMADSDAEKLKDEWGGLTIIFEGYGIQGKNITHDEMPNFFEDFIINGFDGTSLNEYDPITGDYN